MDKLFPFTDSPSVETHTEPRLIEFDSDEADEVISALSSSTARQLLVLLNETPRTATELADDLDTTLQTVQYHLGNLDDADLIEVVDIWYSERGTEMKVYGPTTDAVSLFTGERSKHRLRDYLVRLLGLGLFLSATALTFSILGDRMTESPDTAPTEPTPPLHPDPGNQTPTPTPEPTPTPIEIVESIPVWFEPGVAFFLGGVTVLLAILFHRLARQKGL